MVSIYSSLFPGNSSLVKFGSYDASGIKAGTGLNLIRCVDTESWAVNLFNLTIGNNSIPSLTAKVLFEPGLPFMYVAGADWPKMWSQIQHLFPDFLCQEDWAYCYKPDYCDRSRKDVYFEFKLGPFDKSTLFKIDANKFLLNGSEVGGSPNSCYVGLFRRPDANPVWYVGNLML